jgi:hypothetical protein
MAARKLAGVRDRDGVTSATAVAISHPIGNIEIG